MENIPQNQSQSEQYSIPQLEPTGSNPIPHSPKKLLICFLILTALIGGYFGLAKYQSWWPFRIVSVSPSPSPSVSVVPTFDTSDWKTYRNEDYGFELKYPVDLIKDTVEVSQYGVDTISFSKNDGSDLNIKFQISIDTNLTGGADPLTVIKQQPEKITSGPTDLVIAGVAAKQYKIRWEYKGKEYIYDLAYINYQNKIYEFNDLKLKEDDFKKILSTFKFIKSDTSKISSEQDCGTIGVIQLTTQQKASELCIAQSALNCSPAFVAQLNNKGVIDNKLSVIGKENNYCILSQEGYTPPPTLQTCMFPLSLMPTVLQVSKDSLSSAPGETVESLSLTQIVLSSFLSHKYINPYTNESTLILCK